MLVHVANPSEDAIKSLSKSDFFQNLSDIQILNYSEEPIGELEPGIYNVDVYKSDSEIKVYLSYISYYTPNHIFYWMPVDIE